MNMRDLDKLLDAKLSLKAPPDFTKQLMVKIQSMEPQPSPVRRIYVQWAVSCLAAALILLLINLSPLADLLQNSFTRWEPRGNGFISLEHVPEAIDTFTLKANSFFMKPFHSLANVFRKDG